MGVFEHTIGDIALGCLGLRMKYASRPGKHGVQEMPALWQSAFEFYLLVGGKRRLTRSDLSEGR